MNDDDELIKKVRAQFTPDITPANLERAADAIERLRAELAAAVARAEKAEADFAEAEQLYGLLQYENQRLRDALSAAAAESEKP